MAAQTKIKLYHELIRIPSFDERVNYLRTDSKIGYETFGPDRIFNQGFYQSREWKTFRNSIILRDEGCDMGLRGFQISGPITIHHLNPLTIEDIESGSDFLMNPEYVVCVSHATHMLIHYGYSRETVPNERKAGDTTLWNKVY